MKEKKEKKNFGKKRQAPIEGGLLGWGAVLLFVGLTVIVPLYFEDAYFNIAEAKGHAHLAVTLPVLLLLLAGAVKGRESIWQKVKVKVDHLMLALLALGILAMVSALFSKDFFLSFFGMQGWSMGAYAFLSFPFCMFILVNWLPLPYRRALLRLVWAVNLLIFLIGILNGMAVDPLGMHARIIKKQYFIYMTTIGNVNWYVGYLGMVLPPAFIFYLDEKEGFRKSCLLLYLCLGFANMILTACDGLYLSMGISCAFALPYLLKERKYIEKLAILLGVYGILLLVIGYTPPFAKKAMEIRGLAGRFITFKVGISIFLLACLLYMVVRIFHRQWEAMGKVTRNCLLLVAECLIAGSAFWGLQKALAGGGDRFGNDRGLIWSYSLEAFRKFSLSEKLLGKGPGMLKETYQGLYDHFSMTVLASHNEGLQILLSMGLLGLTVWLLVWILIFWKYKGLRLWENQKIAFFLPAAAYFAQSLVYSPQITNFGLLCISLSFLTKRDVCDIDYQY